MIRVGIVGYNPKKIGGIESFSRTLKEQLPYDIEFIYEYNESGVFDVLGTNPVLSFSFFNRAINKVLGHKFSAFKIKKLLEFKNYDVLILNSPRYLKLAPKLERVILVQHTTVDNWWCSKYKFNRSLELLELSKKVYKIVSLSEYEKKEMLRKFEYHDDLIKTVNMINGLPLINNIITKKNKKKLIMLTRFQNDIKRIDLVIKSMRLLPDFELNVYGSGADRQYLIDLSSSYDNVNIHSATNNKIDVLDENGIYILSSEFEGFPVSVIEAMSRGLPIIIRNSFLSAPCFVHNNGVLISKVWSENEFRDAVLFCNSNYDSLSLESLRLAGEYTPNNVISYWCNLINSAGAQ